MICRYQKHQEIENKEHDQYKEALRILNEELTAIIAKLKGESHLREEAKKVKAGLATKLSILGEQIDKAKVNAVAKFMSS